MSTVIVKEVPRVEAYKVVPWTHRDGSVHLEMRLVSFHDETGELLTHLDSPGRRFVTACNKPWWGVGSASGIAHTERISCPDCRRLLSSLTFTAEVTR
jgi:hypothetical protein